MIYLVALGVALCVCLFQTVANAQSMSYAMWFQPGAQITKFQATMVIPEAAAGPGFHGIWPGLENDSEGFVYQNVVSDSNGPGLWEFFIEYCCNPNVEYTAHTISPGDKITTSFSLNSTSGVWTDSYTISGSNFVSNADSDTFAVGVLDRALLAVELESNATWNFGQVQWTNVAITAATNSTAWCGGAFAVTGSFGFQVSGVSVTTAREFVTCSYSNILFIGPK